MGLLRRIARLFGGGTAAYGYTRGAADIALGGPTDGDWEPIDTSALSEPSDIRAGAVMLTGLALLVTLAIITGLLYLVFAYFSHLREVESPPPIASFSHGVYLPPSPRLQESPVLEMRDMRAYEDRILHGYNWVDKNHGTVSIPIDKAMEMVARQGIPPQTGSGFTYYSPQAGSRRTGFEGKVQPEPR